MRVTLLEPEPLWQWFARRRARAGAPVLLIGIAVVGGLVAATATEVGVRVFNTDWNYVAGYTAQRDRGWEPFLLMWFATTALPLLQGLSGAWLLPMYGRPRDFVGGLAVAVLGSLPIYATVGALVLLPGVLLVCIAFLVSCAWWGSGARTVLGVPGGEAADHVVASIIAGGVALFFLSAVVPFG